MAIKDLKKENLQNPLDKILLLKSNPNYRIGDLIFRQGYRWLSDRESILTDRKYQKSFLYNYLSNLEDPLFDPYFDVNNTIPRDIDHEDLLFQIIENSKPEKLQDDILYIHVRAGDIVQSEYGEIMSMWLMNQNKLIHKITDVIISQPVIRKISIVTALHFGDFKCRSKWIYSKESELLNKKLLLNLIERLNKLKPTNILSGESSEIKSIDKHFLYLCHAKNVILDTSGMSKVALRFRNSLKYE